MNDDPGLPVFPVDDMTLGMVEHALDYCLTFDGEDGEQLDEPRGIGAEFSLHSLLDFLSGTTTDPLGVVQHLGVQETFMGPVEMTVDQRPHYTEKDIILALIQEVRRLRATTPIPPGAPS